MCFFVAAEDFQKQSDFVPVNPTMTHSFTSQQATGMAKVNADSSSYSTVTRKLQNCCFFPTETGVRNSECPTSSFLHLPSDIQNIEKTPLDLHRDGYTFPLVPHHTDMRRTCPLATKTGGPDCPVIQQWNQQGMPFTWSQFQTNEQFLLVPDVNQHLYTDWNWDQWISRKSFWLLNSSTEGTLLNQ